MWYLNTFRINLQQKCKKLLLNFAVLSSLWYLYYVHCLIVVFFGGIFYCNFSCTYTRLAEKEHSEGKRKRHDFLFHKLFQGKFCCIFVLFFVWRMLGLKTWILQNHLILKNTFIYPSVVCPRVRHW